MKLIPLFPETMYGKCICVKIHCMPKTSTCAYPNHNYDGRSTFWSRWFSSCKTFLCFLLRLNMPLEDKYWCIGVSCTFSLQKFHWINPIRVGVGSYRLYWKLNNVDMNITTIIQYIVHFWFLSWTFKGFISLPTYKQEHLHWAKQHY